MISVTEIAAEVAAGNLEAIEAAFFTLVGWPDVDEVGPPSPDVLGYLLEHVAEALKHDAATMPAGLVDLLDQERAAAETIAGMDYAAGSAFVLAHLDRWRQRFERAV